MYALDIGSKKLALAAGAFGRDPEPEALFVETEPSQGIFKGVVNDLSALSGSVQRIFGKMEARTGVRAQQVFVSLNGNYIDARHSIAAMALSERGTRSITRRDIEKLNDQARTLGLDLDETLLHEYPQGYSVDRHNATLNPLSLHGRRFETDLLLVSAKAAYADNIARAVERAGCDAAGLVFCGVAAAEAVLTPQERARGVVLVDLGEALTTVLIFRDGILRRLAMLSIGARNLGDIIASYLKIPLEAADSLKENIEIEREIADDAEVLLQVDSDYKTVKKRELVSLISPELDKFTAMLKGAIAECGCADAARNQVVAIGGLSLLEGFLEKMERDLGQSVRLGIPRGFRDTPPARAATYASAIGLLYWQQKLAQKSFLALSSQGKNQFARAFDYLTHLYQDYF